MCQDSDARQRHSDTFEYAHHIGVYAHDIGVGACQPASKRIKALTLMTGGGQLNQEA
jgi:hypothetical protein